MDNFIWSLEAGSGLLGQMASAGGAFSKAIGTTLGPFQGTLQSILSGKYLGEMLKFETTFRRLTLHMGRGVKESQALHKSIYEVGKNLGVGTLAAQKLIDVLIKGRVAHKDIQNLAISMGKFSEVTDVSNEAVGKLVTNYMKMRGASANTAKAMLTNLAQIQKGFGLTAEGMEAVVNYSSEIVTNLAAMGAQGPQVTGMTSAIGKMAVSFERAGMSAQQAVGWMEKIFSAENFTQNIVMMQKLGISAQDYAGILSGSLPMQDQMNEKLASLGDEIQQLMKSSPIAASAYAKIWGGGLSTSQLIRLSAARKEGQKADETMQKMWGASTGTVAKRIAQLHNAFDNFMKGLLYNLVPAIEPLLLGLIAFVKKVDWAGIGKWLKDKGTKLADALASGNLEANIGKALGKVILEVGKIIVDALKDIWHEIPGWAQAILIGVGAIKVGGAVKTGMDTLSLANKFSGGKMAKGVTGLITTLAPALSAAGPALLIIVGVIVAALVAYGINRLLNYIYGSEEINKRMHKYTNTITANTKQLQENKVKLEDSGTLTKEQIEEIKLNNIALQANTRALLEKERKEVSKVISTGQYSEPFKNIYDEVMKKYKTNGKVTETELERYKKSFQESKLEKARAELIESQFGDKTIEGSTIPLKEKEMLREDLTKMTIRTGASSKEQKEMMDYFMEEQNMTYGKTSQFAGGMLKLYLQGNESIMIAVKDHLADMGYHMEKIDKNSSPEGERKAKQAIWGSEKGELVVEQQGEDRDKQKINLMTNIYSVINSLADILDKDKKTGLMSSLRNDLKELKLSSFSGNDTNSQL